MDSHLNSRLATSPCALVQWTVLLPLSSAREKMPKMTGLRGFKAAVVVPLASMLLVLGAGCGDSDDQARCVSGDAEEAPEYVGLDVADARELARKDGVTFRIVGEDGECHNATLDIRGNRVSAYVDDGRVVAARRY